MDRLRAPRLEERDSDLPLLRLLQLFDSQFPVGAFAHSGGLETYAARGGSLPELRQVLRAQIQLGWGRSELAAAYLAWQAAGDPIDTAALEALGTTLDAMKVVPALRDMSLGLGRRTLELLRRLHPERLPTLLLPHQAIVIGVAGRTLGMDPRALLLAYAQNLASGTLAAAVRCMPIGPLQAQELLVELQPQLCTAAARAMAEPEGSLFTCTPSLDVRSHQQASLHTRLFQT